MRLLLDEHIGPAVAKALARAGVDAVALREWRSGRFLEAPDEEILSEAAEEARVLVTFDQRTVPPLLKAWAEAGRSHGGVIFVDYRTLPPNDVGGMARALLRLNERLGEAEWRDRVVYLARA
ncbi:MAG: DUF5615 family PIN-like protein [Bacillota bacterium]|nr:DUF5615 family PIN-like protein [Bacillota bacterium]